MPLPRRTRQLLPIAFLVGVLVLAAVLLLALARLRVPVPGAGADPGAVWPSSGQAAVSTLDGELETSTDRQQPVPIASVTKIMTALVVLDRTTGRSDRRAPGRRTVRLSRARRRSPSRGYRRCARNAPRFRPSPPRDERSRRS